MRTKTKLILSACLIILISSFHAIAQTKNSGSEKISSAVEADPITRGTICIKKPETIPPLVAPDRLMPDFYSPGMYCGGLYRTPFLTTAKRNFYWSRRFPFIDVSLRKWSRACIRLL